MDNFPVLEWRRSECAVFFKVAGPNGACSNMAGGMPIVVNNITFRTSEALYQAMRFPGRPEIQQTIIEQKSPMAAKTVAKSFWERTRPDWDEVRVPIMFWAVRLKLAQNLETFGSVLEATEKRPIVEQSRKDTFWGAKERDAEVLVGQNTLGHILGEVRNIAMEGALQVPSAPFDDMYLLGEKIE